MEEIDDERRKLSASDQITVLGSTRHLVIVTTPYEQHCDSYQVMIKLLLIK